MFNFRWQVDGQLAGMAMPFVAPGHGGPDDLAELRKIGVAAIVSLTQTPLAPNATARLEFDVLHEPVPDGSAPSMGQIERIIGFINACLAEKKPVAVHCTAGQGRTGTVLACYLVHLGRSAARAIREVRDADPFAIETFEQERAIARYEQKCSDDQDESTSHDS